MSSKAPFTLKFRGNKSFSPFHNLTDGATLTSLWSVVTKVSPFLEEVSRRRPPLPPPELTASRACPPGLVS